MLHDDHFRARRRHSVDLTAILRNHAENWEQEVRIVDLGFDGAKIELGKLVEPDAPITVQITAPTLWDPLVLRGRIIWARQSGNRTAVAGVQFQHQDSAPLFALLELLSAQVYDA